MFYLQLFRSIDDSKKTDSLVVVTNNPEGTKYEINYTNGQYDSTAIIGPFTKEYTTNLGNLLVTGTRGYISNLINYYG